MLLSCLYISRNSKRKYDILFKYDTLAIYGQYLVDDTQKQQLRKTTSICYPTITWCSERMGTAPIDYSSAEELMTQAAREAENSTNGGDINTLYH
jgi:hypothetical protein